MLPALKSSPKPRKTLALDASISLEHLPKYLRVLVDSLGSTLAYKLITVRGGTQVGIPKTTVFDHPLHRELGTELFAELVAKRGGETLEVPKDDAIVMHHRHARVRALRAAGYTRDAVARQTGYGWRQVVNICNEALEDPAFIQADLFAALPSTASAAIAGRTASAANAANTARPSTAKKIAPQNTALQKTTTPIDAQHVPSFHDMFGIARRNAAQAKAARTP